MSERRQHARVRLDIAVDVSSGHAFFATRTRDASEGGLFIETDLPLDVGAKVSLAVRLPAHPVLEVEAEVAWILTETSGARAGLGVRFVDLDPPARAVLSAFMRKNAPMLFEAAEPAPASDSVPPPLPRPPRS